MFVKWSSPDEARLRRAEAASNNDHSVHVPRMCVMPMVRHYSVCKANRLKPGRLPEAARDLIPSIVSPNLPWGPRSPLLSGLQRHSGQGVKLTPDQHGKPGFRISETIPLPPPPPINVGRNSVVGIATRYGLDGPGSNPGGGEIFRTCPHRTCCPPSLLYNGYWVFSGCRTAGAWRWPPTHI
jgi:hypothetical protein